MAEFINIGSGWKKKSKKGNAYISISLNQEAIRNLNLANMNIMLTPNNRKQQPNHPDYNLSAIEKTPRQGQSQNYPPPQQDDGFDGF